MQRKVSVQDMKSNVKRKYINSPLNRGLALIFPQSDYTVCEMC